MTRSPHRPSRRAPVLVAAVVAAWAAGAAEAKQAPPPRPDDLYVKHDTWADTMADTRARHERRRAEAMGRSAASHFKPFSSGIVRGDGPGRSISVNVSNLARVRLVTEMKQHPGNLTIWGGATLVAKDGSRTPLADIKPLSVRVGWGQLYRHKNWQGNPLRIGTKTFEHGLWVHTDSEVVFDLGGRYERLEAWIGMDAARPGGKAVFKVQAGPADLAPLLWQRVSKDFPEQAAWLAEDAGRKREAEWFNHRDDAAWERNLVGRALARLGGAGASLRDQLNRLVQAKTAPGDRRWLVPRLPSGSQGGRGRGGPRPPARAPRETRRGRDAGPRQGLARPPRPGPASGQGRGADGGDRPGSAWPVPPSRTVSATPPAC